MLLILRGSILSFIFFWLCVNDLSYFGIQVRSLNLQRPVIEYINNSFARLINLTSRRYNRRDTVYYLSIYGETYVPLNKHFNVHVSIDEYFSYTAKRRFFDMDLHFCNFIPQLKTNILYKKSVTDEFEKFQPIDGCVLPAGFYFFYNLTWPSLSVPFKLPFQDGRMEVRVYDKNDATVCNGYIDLDLKSNSKIRKSKLQKNFVQL